MPSRLTPITRWCLGLALYGLCWLKAPYTTLGVSLTALLAWVSVVSLEALDDWKKDRQAFDAKAIAELKRQGEENQAIRRMIHGQQERLTQTRITQTREKR